MSPKDLETMYYSEALSSRQSSQLDIGQRKIHWFAYTGNMTLSEIAEAKLLHRLKNAADHQLKQPKSM